MPIDARNDVDHSIFSGFHHLFIDKLKRRWSSGVLARRLADRILQLGLPVFGDGGAMTAVRLRLTLVHVFVASSFGVVGWPPIRTFRMNSLFGQAKDNASDAETKKAAADDSGSQKDKDETEKKVRVPGWVKVNMDGEVIGRKVDLNAHRSYKTLALALEIMFTKPSAGLCASNSTKSLKLLENSCEYQMTYEDRDGDWMLVGDVPWEMFVGSVKRLRIMRTSDASGLG
uniref:Auxin-responsive protein n=1 Tax=Aegilops tauschii TaxID=37682 RepID=M8CAZ6_AEGTA